MKSLTNYYRTRWLLVFLGGVFFCFLTSCQKFLEINTSPNLIQTENVFEDDKTALSAVSGVYLQIRFSTPSLANGTLSIYSGLSADELYNTSSNLNYDPFYNCSLLSTNTIVDAQMWSVAYNIIYRSNAILEGLDKSISVSDPIKRQLTGEMKVIRSLYYFYLINLFGDVPLTTSTEYQTNATIPRTSINIVYQQIIVDLKDAKDILSESYPSQGRLRINKWAAAALLSRVYLFRKMWTESELEATNIINSDTYTLANTDGVFLKGSNESIWEIAYQNDARNTAEGSLFIPSSTTSLPALAMTSHLVNSFDSGDQRKLRWTERNLIGLREYYYPKKYKNRLAIPVTEYDIVFRLGEQYLIRAEARAEQNNIAGAQADLNKIRIRSGLSGVTLNDQSSLLSAIANERKVELFAEWGHRWFDLKRTKRAIDILSPLKGSNWQNSDTLYPIPVKQLQYNSLLVQNAGY